MTLFAALAAPSTNQQGGDTTSATPNTTASNASSSPCSPPEAIQLYSTRLIDFLSGTTLSLSNPNNPAGNKSTVDGATTPKKSSEEESALSERQLRQLQSRHFSALSYQAVQVRQDDVVNVVMPSLMGGQQSQVQRHLRPDLGIWDCRVLVPEGGSSSECEGGDGAQEREAKEAEASAMLLRRVVVGPRGATSAGNVSSAGGNEADGGKEGGSQNETNAKNNDLSKENDDGKVRTVVVSVDLTDPSQVQPTIEQMRKVILNIYGSNENKLFSSSGSNGNGEGGFTTSIKALSSCPFGKNVNSSQVNGETPTTSSTPESNGIFVSQQKIAIVLAAIVPPHLFALTSSSSSPAEAYRERQARALVLYHLNKFALEVDCTLCFVRERGELYSDGAGAGEQQLGENDPLLGRNSTMSIEELGKVVRRVALGMPPLDEKEIMQSKESEGKSGEGSDIASEENGEDESSGRNESSPSRPPAIHVPGSHDSELIHGAYLRNASCEGRWDAGRDDLHVALPPRSVATSKEKQSSAADAKKGVTAGGGDEEWLSKLASSVGLTNIETSAGTNANAAASGGSLTPADRKKEMLKQREAMSKKKSLKPAASSKKLDGKPKDQKEVMNFFGDLLKK